MEIWQYAVLIIASLAGGTLAYRLNKSEFNSYHLFLSFSGSYLLGVIVLHLIPETYAGGDYKIGIFILAGFFAQVMLEQFSQGIEHGHIHIHEGGEHGGFYIYGLVIGLSVHAFFEGIPLGNQLQSMKSVNSLLIGIALHKIPETFALMNILLHFKMKKISLLLLFGIFCFITPASALLVGNVNLQFNGNYIVAFVVGSFLHITTTILFESSNKSHRFTFFRIIAILLGVGISLLTI